MSVESRSGSESESESESELDQLQDEIESGLAKAVSVIEESVTSVDQIITGIRLIKKKVGKMELQDNGLQKDMFSSKFRSKVSVEGMDLKEGHVVTFKSVINKLILWIEKDEMEKDGFITPNREMRKVFGIKESVTFQELVSLLKKILH
jgi:hypothetical protein